MKNSTSYFRIKKLIIQISLVLILFTGGCYEIQNIIQPDKVDANNSFNVKIVINVTDEADPDFLAYAYLGILLPEGWKVKDSINYTKKGRISSQLGVFDYNQEAALFLNNKLGLAPLGYYWWGARSNDRIQLFPLDSGFVNLTIKTNDKPGKFKIKYVFGDDCLLNKEDYELFGIPEGAISEFIPIEVVVTSAQALKFGEIKVYPNPATDKVTFSWDTNYNKLNLKLYQANGACLMERKFIPLTIFQ